MSFKVGPVWDSLGTIQTGVAGAAYTITPTTGIESVIAKDYGDNMGPWVQLVSAVSQTTAASVLITLEPK